ncbi:hypothetical protein AAFZ98_004599 [Vibrio parahaemolyticus]|uniref:hypothetical protein n=1 Tax=Vibrio parahaemolyticus TaxID=670 RepID=UPI00040B22CD|nr:hypothetical protein [Vibrio parahaemolyticus]MBE3867267.1 hypothetical protein [Vibrio parahaemolyticus]MDG3050559.1 hypothetical protein [Vibrio parahaemolyticus]HCG6065879.1 hypothetical protein [Vibrio parahaemolyticus]
MLNIDEILDKGLTNIELLTEDEKLIFVVVYLESVADMEGWDHFFTYNMNWYPVLIKSLQLASDETSLKIIENYKQHFIKLGVNFHAESIESFLASAGGSYLENCPDWRELFAEASEQRWLKIEAYFSNRGVKICT